MRYQEYDRRKQTNKQNEPHPIWRGIGCLTMIIIPVMSYALAVVTVQIGLKAKWPLPYQLLGAPRFPDIVWSVPQLTALVVPLTRIDNLYANLFFAVFYMVILSGIGSLAYAMVYRAIGPARYGPQDVPPPNIKTKKYKR